MIVKKKIYTLHIISMSTGHIAINKAICTERNLSLSHIKC